MSLKNIGVSVIARALMTTALTGAVGMAAAVPAMAQELNLGEQAQAAALAAAIAQAIVDTLAVNPGASDEELAAAVEAVVAASGVPPVVAQAAVAQAANAPVIVVNEATGARTTTTLTQAIALLNPNASVGQITSIVTNVNQAISQVSQTVSTAAVTQPVQVQVVNLALSGNNVTVVVPYTR